MVARRAHVRNDALKVLDGERVVGEERLLTGLGARIRDVAVGGDGAVYVITDDENGQLVRLRRAD